METLDEHPYCEEGEREKYEQTGSFYFVQAISGFIFLIYTVGSQLIWQVSSVATIDPRRTPHCFAENKNKRRV